MAITLSSGGGNIYDAAGTYTNARERAQATANDYYSSLRRSDLDARAMALNFQAKQEDNQLQIQLANQRVQQESNLAARRDERDFAMAQYQESSMGRRDERQHGYDRQNATQREAFDVRERWGVSVTEAKKAGRDFSEKQNQQLKALDENSNKIMADVNLDELTKQNANLLIERKRAAILPNEKTSTPEEEVDQQYYESEKYGTLKRSYDTQGRPEWVRDVDVGFVKQKERLEKHTADIHKLEFERNAEVMKMIEDLSKIKGPDEVRPLYGNTPEGQAELKAAVIERYGPSEKSYQKAGVPAHAWFETGEELPQPSPDGVARPQQEAAPAAPAAPLVIISTLPLPKDVSKQLQTMPGGKQLYQMREKYNSNSLNDMILREASDVVIKAMLTGDTSDPDLAEAEEMLIKAGLKAGK